ncbi:MAG: hypothetical protein ABMB14_15775 [Myxococcota bacterium]
MVLTLSMLGARAADGPSSEITSTELAWMAREVAPIVEQVAGRPLRVMPELVLATPARIAEVVYQEQLSLLQGVGGMPETEAKDNARKTAADVSGSFAGKYGFLDGKLYVSIDGIRDSLALEGEPDWLLRPMVRIVVAHELTHALQDQYTDLQALVQRAPSGDAIMAINCAVEGHAVWVHEQVGAQTGLGDAVEVMERLLGYDQPIRRRMDPDDFYHAYVYGLGRDFVAYQAAIGGIDRVWQVLAHPPEATGMIVDPTLWDAPIGEVDPEVRRVMRVASKRLAGKGWRPTDGAMGDYDVRDQLIRAGADSAIADDLDAGWNSRLVGGANLGVEVQVLRFKSVDGARAFVEDMGLQAEAQAELVGVDPFIRADAGSFDRVRGDRSAREAITVSLMGPVDRLGRIWVSRGDVVVQIVMVNAPATDREVALSIDRVFRELASP